MHDQVQPFQEHIEAFLEEDEAASQIPRIVGELRVFGYGLLESNIDDPGQTDDMVDELFAGVKSLQTYLEKLDSGIYVRRVRPAYPNPAYEAPRPHGLGTGMHYSEQSKFIGLPEDVLKKLVDGTAKQRAGELADEHTSRQLKNVAVVASLIDHEPLGYKSEFERSARYGRGGSLLTGLLW
jgi:hypothetical protein